MEHPLSIILRKLADKIDTFEELVKLEGSEAEKKTEDTWDEIKMKSDMMLTTLNDYLNGKEF